MIDLIQTRNTGLKVRLDLQSGKVPWELYGCTFPEL